MMHGIAMRSRASQRSPRRAALAACLTLAAVIVCGSDGAAAADRSAPPNIVFVLADDLGYGELGCYGQQKIRTPRIDSLATDGMRFTRHYSGSPVCAPSRCVLMTGLHPGHAHIRDNAEHQPEGQKPIPAEAVTIAELLRDRGYVCGAFGKWGLGYPGSEGDPLRQGFARFFGYNCQRHAHSYYPSYLWSDEQRIKLDNDPPVPGHAKLPAAADPNDPASYAPFKGKDYAPDRIIDAALGFIRDNKDRPFFCYYPTLIPHLALHVPDAELVPYLKEQWPETPFTGGGYTPHQTPRAAYAAMISRMDKNVGRILDLLDELGIADNTIVIFTSDNGPSHLSREVDAAFFNSSAVLRGFKGSLYEGGIRVPMLIRWPGRIKPGATSDRITGFEDWLPTLLDLIGAADKTPQRIDGISFAPTLLGKPQDPRPWLYREFAGYGGQQALWMDGGKAIRTNLHKSDGPIQLYNLTADETESRDFAGEDASPIDGFHRTMMEQHTPSALFPIKALDAATPSAAPIP